jgi:hypothetical protein
MWGGGVVVVFIFEASGASLVVATTVHPTAYSPASALTTASLAAPSLSSPRHHHETKYDLFHAHVTNSELFSCIVPVDSQRACSADEQIDQRLMQNIWSLSETLNERKIRVLSM